MYVTAPQVLEIIPVRIADFICGWNVWVVSSDTLKGLTMTHITVERMNGDLEKQQWFFWYRDDRHALVLKGYCALSRPSKRHKFQIKIGYSYSAYSRQGDSMPADDVPLPDDVKEEAKQKFIEGLEIGKFDEYR